jgi:pimeloyl-ACP methyl ester carboxylesterase
VRSRLPPNSYGYAMQVLGGMGWSSWSFLPDIPHETLVVCGDDDPLVPLVNARMLAERIPRAKLEVVERAGHLLLWDEPERIAPQIGRFIGWA